jgi:hypothetical protein
MITNKQHKYLKIRFTQQELDRLGTLRKRTEAHCSLAEVVYNIVIDKVNKMVLPNDKDKLE